MRTPAETRVRQRSNEHFRQRCASRAISIRLKSIIYEPVVSASSLPLSFSSFSFSFLVSSSILSFSFANFISNCFFGFHFAYLRLSPSSHRLPATLAKLPNQALSGLSSLSMLGKRKILSQLTCMFSLSFPFLNLISFSFTPFAFTL